MSQLYYKIMTGVVWAGKVRGIVRGGKTGGELSGVEKRERNYCPGGKTGGELSGIA